jgi:hypothetical protein
MVMSEYVDMKVGSYAGGAHKNGAYAFLQVNVKTVDIKGESKGDDKVITFIRSDLVPDEVMKNVFGRTCDNDEIQIKETANG